MKNKIPTFLKRVGKKVYKKEISDQDKFIDYAKSKGCWAAKLIINRLRSFPDLTVICPGGLIFFIEFKRWLPGKPIVITANQNKKREKLIGLGFRYFVCHTFDQAKRVLDGMISDAK